MPRHAPRPKVDRVREQAARLLLRYWEGDGFIEDVVERFETSDVGAVGWEYVERRRLRELLFGGVRLRDRYDHLVAAVARSSKGCEPRLRAVLHIALHEICEMRRQEFAVVDQAVEITRRWQRPAATGFVNAALRRVLREGVETFFVSAEEDPLLHACTWGSHPRWLVERWADLLGPQEMLALCECNNRRPRIHLRCPRGKKEQIREVLGRLEWESAPISFAPDALEMRTRVPASLLLKEVGSGVVIQDAAAQMVAPLVAESAPASVLDLCAAPGGKTSHLVQLLPEARITAADVSVQRLDQVAGTLERLGQPDRVRLRQVDGCHTGWEEGSFDAVLVDAPCTGTGVLARRQDARYRRRPEDLEELPRLQKALVEEALRLVKPGGEVVYATCSLEHEENDAVIDAILEQNPEVEEIGVGAAVAPDLQRGGRMQIWPQRHGSDGAFAARLRRPATGEMP